MERGDVSSGDMGTGIAVGLDRERGAPDVVGPGSESRVLRESVDEIEVFLVLKPDLCGRDSPLEREFVGVEGRTERPISRGLVD